MTTYKVPTKASILAEDDHDIEPLYTLDDRQAIVDITTEAITSVDQTNTPKCPISSRLARSLTKTFCKKPMEDLGSLSGLPLELVFTICLELDVKSCLALRQVSSRAREIVTSLSEYSAVTTHALGVVQAVLWSGMASRVTFAELYRLLYTHECMICSTRDSTDAFRFYDSRAPKHRPQITPGIKSLEVGRAALDKAVTSSAPQTADKTGKVKEEEPHSTAPVKKKPTALTVLSMANADGTNTDDRSVNAAANTAANTAASANANANETAAGLFLFLPTLTRCCKPCLEESPRLRVVPLASLRAAADLPRRHFLPHACVPWLADKKTMPPQQGTGKGKGKGKGKSKGRGRDCKSSASSVGADEAYKVKVGTVTQDLAAQVLFDAGFTSKRVEAVLFQSGYLDEFCWWDEVSSRSKFTVMMPFLDHDSNTTKCGFTCRGCDAAIQKLYGHLKVALVYTNTVFSTEAAFFDHFAGCPDAIKMWKQQTGQAEA